MTLVIYFIYLFIFKIFIIRLMNFFIKKLNITPCSMSSARMVLGLAPCQPSSVMHTIHGTASARVARSVTLTGSPSHGAG